MSNFHILKETKDKRTFILVSSGLAQPHDLAWGDQLSPNREGHFEGAVEARVDQDFISVFLGSSWARRGFNRSILPGEKIFAVNLDTKEKILVYSVNSDNSWTDHTFKPYEG